MLASGFVESGSVGLGAGLGAKVSIDLIERFPDRAGSDQVEPAEPEIAVAITQLLDDAITRGRNLVVGVGALAVHE